MKQRISSPRHGLIAIALLAIASRAAAECPWYKTDIGILVDMKASLGQTTDDRTVRPFITDFVNSLKKDAKSSPGSDVRVGIISYGGKLEIQHPMTGDQSKKALLNAADKYEFEPGMMTLDKALKDCIDNKCYPSWDDKGRKKILVVLTGAKYEKLQSLQTYAKRDVTFFAYNIDHKKFNNKPIGEGAKNSIDIGRSCVFEKFATELTGMIQAEQCRKVLAARPTPPAPPPPKKLLIAADIVFVIDDTFSLSKAQWKQEIDLAQALVDRMVVGGLGARFSALTFSHSTIPGFDWLDDATATKKALAALKFTKGGTTFTGMAIQKADREYLGTKHKPRAGVKTLKTIVVITDGSPSNPKRLRNAVSAAKAKGIVILAVGVGPGVMMGDKPNRRMLDIVSGDASRLFVTADFNKLGGKVAEMMNALKNME